MEGREVRSSHKPGGDGAHLGTHLGSGTERPTRAPSRCRGQPPPCSGDQRSPSRHTWLRDLVSQDHLPSRHGLEQLLFFFSCTRTLYKEMACLEKDFGPLRERVTALATLEVVPLGNSKQASQHSTPHLLPPSCPATGGLRTGAPLPHPGRHHSLRETSAGEASCSVERMSPSFLRLQGFVFLVLLKHSLS